MSLPSGFLDEMRARLTLSEVVARKVRLTRTGREFKACCPFHKEKSPSFTVNDAKGFFHCFGCGAHGDAIGFMMRSENRSFMEAVEVLAHLAGLEVPKATPEEHQKFEEEKSLYTLIEDATKWFEEQLHLPTGRAALDYIQKRGLADETINRFRLGFAPHDGQALVKYLAARNYTSQQMIDAGLVKKAEGEERLYSFFRGRLIFPVGDRRGRIVAFGARLLDGDGPKYINSADHSLFHKGQLLYGFSRARAAAADGKPLIITEGYMDVIRLSEAGFAGAVAPLGTALTEEQIGALWKIIPRPPVRPDLQNHIPILCFDGDAAGQRAAERALDRILPHIGPDQSVRFALMVEGEDPDSLIRSKGPAAMQAILDSARPLIDFMWGLTAAGRPLNTPEDRAGFRKALYARIAAIKDEGVKEGYYNEIKKRLSENFGAAEKIIAGKLQKGRTSGLMFYGKPRPLPNNLQEQIALALLINHPALFPEMEDAVHHLPLVDHALEPLRDAVFAYMGDATQAHDDAQALRDHLEKTGFGSLLEKITGPQLLQHARYTHPKGPLSAARQGWREIWLKHQRAMIADALKHTGHDMANDSDEENTVLRQDQMRTDLARIDEALDKNSMGMEVEG